jgi:hypothetical protein
MDDIITPEKAILQNLPNKIMELIPVTRSEPKVPREVKRGCLEPDKAPCLLKGENVKGRYIALKSANDRQIIATGFTRALAHKRAMRKGHGSCIVISNQ